MSQLTLALGSLGLMLVLLALRLPIGVAMGSVAFFGFWYVRNFNVALSVVRDSPFVFAASWDLSAIPMFLLMGAVAGRLSLNDIAQLASCPVDVVAVRSAACDGSDRQGGVTEERVAACGAALRGRLVGSSEVG